MAYLRAGCDGVKAIASLHPELTKEQCYNRSYNLLQREDIKQAISDKLALRESKYDTSRQAIVERLFGLFDKLERLPDTQLARSIKLELEVLRELSSISGHHIQRHEVDSRNVSINLVGIEQPAGNSVDVPAETKEEINEPEQAPPQLLFPRNEEPAPDLVFGLDDLGHISEPSEDDPVTEDPDDN